MNSSDQRDHIQERTKLISEFLPSFLDTFGENTSREGLQETPQRVAKMYEELLSGYSGDVESIFKTFESNGYQDLVTVSNIGFYSLCEHHMVPFFGKVHIGYIPNGRVLGLSKFARLVDVFSRRLQTQEHMTYQIVDALQKYLKPQGLIVSVEAQHLCMSMRGVKKDNCVTKTTVVRGMLEDRIDLVNQFYSEINRELK